MEAQEKAAEEVADMESPEGRVGEHTASSGDENGAEPGADNNTGTDFGRENVDKTPGEPVENQPDSDDETTQEAGEDDTAATIPHGSTLLEPPDGRAKAGNQKPAGEEEDTANGLHEESVATTDETGVVEGTEVMIEETSDTLLESPDAQSEAGDQIPAKEEEDTATGLHEESVAITDGTGVVEGSKVMIEGTSDTLLEPPVGHSEAGGQIPAKEEEDTFTGIHEESVATTDRTGVVEGSEVVIESPNGQTEADNQKPANEEEDPDTRLHEESIVTSDGKGGVEGSYEKSDTLNAGHEPITGLGPPVEESQSDDLDTNQTENFALIGQAGSTEESTPDLEPSGEDPSSVDLDTPQTESSTLIDPVGSTEETIPDLEPSGEEPSSVELDTHQTENSTVIDPVGSTEEPVPGLGPSGEEPSSVDLDTPQTGSSTLIDSVESTEKSVPDLEPPGEELSSADLDTHQTENSTLIDLVESTEKSIPDLEPPVEEPSLVDLDALQTESSTLIDPVGNTEEPVPGLEPSGEVPSSVDLDTHQTENSALEEPIVVAEEIQQGHDLEVQPEGQEPEPLTTEDGRGEEEEELEEKIPEDFYYNYESICSQPYVTPESGIPGAVLQLQHSFGYDCNKRANLHLLDDQTLLYVAGTMAVILNLTTQEQRYLRSSSGGGIGAVTVHPSRKYFAVAEKGCRPNIILYEFPSLKPYRILRGGTEEAYAFVDFNMSGTLLASVGSSPDYMLTLWDWKQEKTMLRSKAFSQDVIQVTFSPENEAQLTSCGTGHIRFWKMARTFTGLKLQGELGRFGKTALTDIEGYVQLPDGKVISGSEWGNMLLWEGGLIKVEICRRGRRPCHSGSINQFVLDEGELITIGADGYVRVWDFETIDTADTVDDTGLLEMEPMNELQVGKNVNLRFMVKMKENDLPLWFAQDASGGIWKLDLSFSNITQDPERLFSFHSGKIKALDASPSTYLMATTSLDRSVRIYDFIGKSPLVEMTFKQGGTSLIWAPRMVNPKGGLFAVGFEDGVVRILEVSNASGMRRLAGRRRAEDAAMTLKQAFKPHTAAVTALAYERNGEILATGSVDKTVFFFAVGDTYEPVGFVRVPGPVKELHWSPPTHEENALLVLCDNGFAVEIQAPATQRADPLSTYQISGLPLSYFRFSSIKSKIEREEQLARIQKKRQQKLKEHQGRLQQKKEQGAELTEEDLQEPPEDEEEELPELYVPKDPSPILCGFYASPGKFWLSMGGYDSGFLYLCEFSKSEEQMEEPSSRRDEPLRALPIQDTGSNPIHKMHFSSNRQLLFCGMQDGAVRVYPLQPNDPLLSSMGSYWSLGVHDNQYGTVQALSSSFDNQYLVTCGGDANIFTFSILSMEDIERDLKAKKAKVPSPRINQERERPAEDIEDPNAYSIEDAKQKRERDLLLKQAEEKKAGKRQALARLREEFRQLLGRNAALPPHMQLGRSEFEMDHRIREEMERQTSERLRTVLRELAWEQEKHNIGLRKLQSRFRDEVEFDTVMVRAIGSEHQVSTYRLLSLSEKYHKVKGMPGKRRMTAHELFPKKELPRDGPAPGAVAEAEPGHAKAGEKQKSQWAGGRSEGQVERIRKIIEKAEKAKSKISQRKQEWDELYKTRPSEDYEDPQDILAIKNARENMGDYKLKTANDYTVPEHQRMNAERKRSELAMLESMMHEQKSAMNRSILALRDLKAETIEKVTSLVQQLKVIQSSLDPSKHLPIPKVPSMSPEETPEKTFQYDKEKLQKFKAEQERRVQTPQSTEESGFGGFGAFGGNQQAPVTQTPSRPSTSSTVASYRTPSARNHQAEEAELSELEKEMIQIEETKNLYMQENIIRQISDLVTSFDAELRLLRHKKVQLDVQMKMGDLRHITLFEELLMLKEFEKREDVLQEKVTDRISELEEMKRKSEDYLQQLEAKRKEMAKLQERERSLHATFLASLGDNNRFATFLTKVFRKKIKRTKKKEATGDQEEDEDSEDESDEESAYESDEEEAESEEGVFDDSVCPDNCDPEVFDGTLRLRDMRLDVEEALAEEKKLVDNLKKEYDALAKKVKIVEVNLKTAEAELEAFQREKQQKLNELHVVVPLKLHQVDYVIKGEIPSDLSQALVFTNRSLEGLQQRIKELQLEKVEKRELYKQAREQHKQLIRERKEMEGKIQGLEEKCRQQMMMKFGRLVDLEALQTLSVNTNLEELKMKASERQLQMDQEIAQWEAKVLETKKSLMEVTREQTKRLERMNQVLTEKKAIEAKLDARQTVVGEEFQGPRKADVRERQKLLHLVQMQVQEMESLKEEILLLKKKGGSILPPAHPPPAPIPHSAVPLL
ncbi:cilia- and flagella-associated protein 44 [Gastrophryne carolinensis]